MPTQRNSAERKAMLAERRVRQRGRVAGVIETAGHAPATMFSPGWGQPLKPIHLRKGKTPNRYKPHQGTQEIARRFGRAIDAAAKPWIDASREPAANEEDAFRMAAQ